jgi:hypothetical protein
LSQVRKQSKSQIANPHAERLNAEQIGKLVRGHYGMKTVVFDKEIAQEVLAYNTGNRRINRRKLQQLVDQMTRGDFINTGEPIIISREGVLNDGQHRLQAVVEADVEVDMDIRFGISREAFRVTDTGASRTPGDVLTIMGAAAGGQVSSTVRLLLLYERGLPESIREFVSHEEIARAFERWDDVEEVIAAVNRHPYPKAVKSIALYATAYLASRTPSKGKLDTWLDAVATGLDVGRDHPAYQVRERLLRGIPAATREGLLERFALMAKSWNLFAKGDTVPMREFRWTSLGKNAEDFPKVAGAKL